MSDQDQSLFDGIDGAATSAASGLTGLEDLVGEGKKYRTPEDALKSVPHAQKHIQELEHTLEELRTELTKRTTLEEALEKLRQGNNSIADGTGGDTQTQTIDPDSIAKLVEGFVEKREATKTYSENQRAVVSALKDAFGEKARDIHDTRLKEIGMSQEEFTSLASRSPRAALALFPDLKVSNKATSGATSSGSVSTENFSGNGQVKQGTYAWYNQMRTTDPKKYFSREVQVEMARKAKELGSSFYS